MSPKHVGACLTAVTVAAALTGCGGGDSGSKASGGASSGGAASGSAIEIVNFKFNPTPLKVSAGQKIIVTNSDSALHTVTADDKSFDTKNLKKGQTFTLTAPSKAGTYNYVCDIHQYMKGSLEVS